MWEGTGQFDIKEKWEMGSNNWLVEERCKAKNKSNKCMKTTTFDEKA